MSHRSNPNPPGGPDDDDDDDQPADLPDDDNDDDDDDEDEDEEFVDEDTDESAAPATARELSVDEELPWDDSDEDDEEDDDRDPHGPYDLGITWKESEVEDDFSDSSVDDVNFRPFDRPDKLPDDIDFPHHRDDHDSGFNDDDIPF
jgi:hypothetical protein